MEIIIIILPFLLLSIYLVINIKQNLNNLSNVYNHNHNYNYDSIILTDENKIILDKLITKYFDEEDYNDEFNQINTLMNCAEKIGGKTAIIYVEHKLGIRNIN